MDPEVIDQAIEYLHKDAFDPNTMCRCCLLTGVPVRFVLEKFAERTLILEECTQIVIDDDDGLPRGLCVKCFSDLLSAYSFLRRCRQAETVLKTFAASKTPDVVDEAAEMKIALSLRPTEVDLPEETDELMPIDEPAIEETIFEPLPVFEDDNEPFKESSFETMPIYHGPIEVKSEVVRMMKKNRMPSPIKSRKYLVKKPTVEPFKRPVMKHAPCSSKKPTDSLPPPKSSKAKDAFNEELKKFQCKVCDKKLNDFMLLKQHMNTHIIKYNSELFIDDLHNYSKRPRVEIKETYSLPPEKPKGLMKIDLNNFKIMNKVDIVRQPALRSLTILPLNTETTPED